MHLHGLSTGFYSGTYIIQHTTKWDLQKLFHEIVVTLTADLQPEYSVTSCSSRTLNKILHIHINPTSSKWKVSSTWQWADVRRWVKLTNTVSYHACVNITWNTTDRCMTHSGIARSGSTVYPVVWELTVAINMHVYNVDISVPIKEILLAITLYVWLCRTCSYAYFSKW